MDGRRKRITKSAFSFTSVGTGEKKPKTQVWAKIVCFVFVKTKTDTFENALVWFGP